MAKTCLTVSYVAPDEYRKRPEPCVRFGGVWLKEFGFRPGDRLELISGKNMLILVKAQDEAGAGPDAAPPAGRARLAI